MTETKFSSAADINKLLEGYRYRIVSLEIELRQLVKQNHISNYEFRKRRLKIKKLRELVSANPKVQEPIDTGFHIPNQDDTTAAIPLSMEEHEIYVLHMKEHTSRLQSIKKEAAKEKVVKERPKSNGNLNPVKQVK